MNEANDIASEFIEKLERLHAEGIKIRDNEKLKEVWSPAEDEILEQLEELIDLARTTSAQIAESELNEYCPLAGHQSFMAYLINKPSQNLDLLRFTNKGTARTKVNRTTSKIDKCRYCGAPAKIQGSKMVCTSPTCGESEEIVSKTSKLKVNAMKHSKNKIQALIGSKEPPKKIQDLYPLIEIWITDLHYLFDWLHYQETFAYMRNPITFDSWMKEFRLVSRFKQDSIPMKIEQTKESAWTFLEYKLIIGEFWSMLNECNRLSQADYTRSNMGSLDDDKIYEIMKSYCETKKDSSVSPIPAPCETFEYEGLNYDIGNYINEMRLSNESSNIRTRLESLFGCPMCIPGLMTNYLMLTTNKVERHALTEGYAYIVHRAFRIPYSSIDEDDIERMLEIIQAFDAYVRSLSKDTTKKHNSQLYVCKIRCILSLPYFFKYAPVADYMTVKSPDTAAKIGAQWDRFTSGVGKELIDQYYDIPGQTNDVAQPNSQPETEPRRIFDGLI